MENLSPYLCKYCGRGDVTFYDHDGHGFHDHCAELAYHELSKEEPEISSDRENWLKIFCSVIASGQTSEGSAITTDILFKSFKHRWSEE